MSALEQVQERGIWYGLTVVAPAVDGYTLAEVVRFFEDYVFVVYPNGETYGYWPSRLTVATKEQARERFELVQQYDAAMTLLLDALGEQ
jgi:hypothetical protein